MKIRSGFVSNSSSSSFLIVEQLDAPIGKAYATLNDAIKLTDKQRKLLTDIGFLKVNASFPEQVADCYNNNHTQVNEDDIQNTRHWGLYVICNQDDTIRDLIKNKISFTADVHYGQETWFYDAKTDMIRIGENVGKQMLMSIDWPQDQSPVKGLTGEEWLRKDREWRAL